MGNLASHSYEEDATQEGVLVLVGWLQANCHSTCLHEGASMTIPSTITGAGTGSYVHYEHAIARTDTRVSSQASTRGLLHPRSNMFVTAQSLRLRH